MSDEMSNRAWAELFSSAALILEDKDLGCIALADRLVSLPRHDLIRIVVAGATAVGWLAEKGVPEGIPDEEAKTRVLAWLRQSAAGMRE